MSSELKKASVGPVFIGGILVLLFFGLLVWVWFGLAGKPDDFEAKRAAARLAKLDVLQKDNHEKLTSYAWINKDKGIVQLPIDRAEEVVLAELKAKPVRASSVKVEVPYPAGLQQAPAAAAPAASGTTAPAASPAAAVASPSPSAAPAASPVTPATPEAATPSPAPAATSTPVP